MKIYTRTGDTGDTGLAGGGRTEKDSPTMHAVGSVDELNAALGLPLASEIPLEIEKVLKQVQSPLFDLGAVLAARADYDPGVDLPESEITWLENQIDNLDRELPALRQFILPGGHPCAAQMHMARAICRRAEREVVALHRNNKPKFNTALVYLNRLSDYLFVAARTINVKQAIEETPWLGAAANDGKAAE